MHRCCLCPEHADVTDLHHIVPISEDGPDTEDNLIVVCPNCHRKIHAMRGRYTPRQLRMYKVRWVQLCGLGLSGEERLMLALTPDHGWPLDAILHAADPKRITRDVDGNVHTGDTLLSAALVEALQDRRQHG